MALSAPECPFKWKDTIYMFPVSPGSAKALVRWSGKIKYLLIAYFLTNICDKNYQNRFMYISVTVRQSSDIFGHTVYMYMSACYVENDFWDNVYTRLCVFV